MERMRKMEHNLNLIKLILENIEPQNEEQKRIKLYYYIFLCQYNKKRKLQNLLEICSYIITLNILMQLLQSP